MKFINSLIKGIKTPNNKIVPLSKKFCSSNRERTRLNIENSSSKIQNSCIRANGESIPKKRKTASVAVKMIILNK
tara:strand:+ start:124 stop:348 length:225 start_codon:yes stop_codon:yes gene_type:complete